MPSTDKTPKQPTLTTALNAQTPIQYLKGVGPARAKLFEKLEIFTLGDLLCHYPRKYIDYTKPYCVATAPYDLACVIKAEVFAKHPKRRLPGGRTMERVSAGDESASLELTWFNNPYATQKLTPGTEYYFEGVVSGSLDRRQIVNPIVRTEAQVQQAPLLAIYPQTEGLSSGIIAKCIAQLLTYVSELPEPLPTEMLEKYRLPTKAEAVQLIHCPTCEADVFHARRRLIYEELFILQLGIGLLKHRDAQHTGAPMRPFSLAPFWESLPFSPTGAQSRAANEIIADMTGTAAMNRLLQGDVGSGKTLVAAAAIYAAYQNGYQSALLAPTEILATQHANGLADTLGKFGVRTALYTGGLRAAEKRAVLAALAAGEVDLLIGTHAILHEDVQLPRLGLAIIDEQHRFGVRQRGLIAQKGAAPHLLVMSATPIPRTLGLLLYGDLDISILDELPPGRKPIQTRYITGKRRADLYGFLDKQIDAGHQVY
ncbi:MAG: DEAD/DEAH box helicase, partial [Faecalibacterium sp.]